MESLARTARSVLSHPGAGWLEIEGGVQVDVRDVEMSDVCGTPRLSCPVGTALATYAERSARAVLRLDAPAPSPAPSPAASPGRADGEQVGDRTLTLAGVLVHRGVEACECCDQVRHVVHLELDFVLLTTWSRVGARRFVVGRPQRIEVADFAAPEHALNPGYLRAAAEHATACHQDELRGSIAARTGSRPEQVLGARLAALTPAAVELAWVDQDGGHRTELTFARPATDPHELAASLRARLGVVAC